MGGGFLERMDKQEWGREEDPCRLKTKIPSNINYIFEKVNRPRMGGRFLQNGKSDIPKYYEKLFI